MKKAIEVSISCADCVRQSTPDCADCLVSYVLGDTPDELVLTRRDAEVVELFNAEGLIPRLRYHPATPP